MKADEFILRALLKPISALPLKVHYFNAGILSWLAENVIRYRRDEVLINIGRAFPCLDYSDIKRIRHEFYVHFGNLIAETIWFGGCKNPDRLRKARLVSIRNPELLDTIDTKPGGIMFLCSHCGNWELLGGIAIPDCYAPGHELPFTASNVCVSYMKQSSQAWDNIIKDNRFAPLDQSLITGYMETHNIVRFIMSHRDEKKYYHMITDQRPYMNGAGKISVNFLGQECHTMSAAAALARKSDLPVVYLRMRATERGHYEMEYVPISTDPSGMSVEEMMGKYYELLSEDIKEQPFNYLWTHRRWAR